MLIAFDIDGTLVRSFLREGAPAHSFDQVELLPLRAEWIARLRRTWGDKLHMVLITNQGGCALGYQTVGQIACKIKEVQLQLGLPSGYIRTGRDAVIDYRGRVWTNSHRAPVAAYVSLGLPHATIDSYRVPAGDPWRKPGPGMLVAAMADHDHIERETLYVGDMDSDAAAADAAGVDYADAAEFFAPLT